MRKKFIFSGRDFYIWIVSLAVVLISCLIFGGQKWYMVLTSLLGVTSLVFLAEGNPVGHLLIIVFSTVYGGIAFSLRYYGELITYVGMTLPMAVSALITWLKNPFNGNLAEVKINRLPKREWAVLPLITAAVTVAFYFILGALNTANLVVSTLSVSTSFFAAYLTFRRSPYYALAYAVNDIVLIALWGMAALSDPACFSPTICFAVFLFNDIYGYICWHKREREQQQKEQVQKSAKE